MPAPPTFDAAGFSGWRTADVRESLVDSIHAAPAFGVDAQTGPSTVLGQVLDCPAPEIGLVYDLLQAIWDAWDPDNAEGVALDNIVRLNGLTRQAPTYGTVTLTLTGTPATVIPAGSRARVPGGLIFAIDADTTIPGGGTVDAPATATTTGTAEAPAGSVDTIVDAVSGWSSVTNALDAKPGTAWETDAELRLRREQTISGAGSCTDQAAKAALDALADITASVVVSNRTDVTDGRGVYPRTRLCVVYPSTGDAQGIARAIWDHLGGGLSTQGAQSAQITNAQGYVMTVRWDNATPANIYWVIDVTTNADYPADGDDLIKAAVLAYGNGLSVGDDVLPIGAVDAIVGTVPGVVHLVVKVGKTAAPTGTVPLDIDLTEVGVHDTTRITVNS